MIVSYAFELFLERKKLQGCSKKTIYCYRDVISAFVEFLGVDSDMSVLTRDKYLEYIGILSRRNYSKSTYASYVRQIKVFLRWIEDEFGVDLVTSKLRVPKSHKRIVHIFSDDEIKLIFDSVTSETEWITVRNKCMIALMLDSGIRQNEVCTLMSADIYWDNSTLKVTGKGSKERIVPFGKLSRTFMQRYLELCPFSLDNFFVGRRGVPVSTDSVKHFMYKLSSRLPFEFSSHRLRHNFATNYCLDQYFKYGQVDLYRLMILMGHEEVETTRVYLHHANQIIASITAISHLDKVMDF